MNNEAFEKAFSELKCAIYSKDDFFKIWQAATKAAIGSRVVLPTLESPAYDSEEWKKLSEYQMGYKRGFDLALEKIKLLPLTAEQVDSLLPSYESVQLAATKDSASFRNDNKEKYCTNKDFVEARMNAFIRGANYVRESIKKRLGAV